MVKLFGRAADAVIVSAGLIMLMAGCAESGHISVTNDGSSEVTVSSGNTKFTVTGGDQAEIAGSDCTAGDVAIRFSDGQTTDLKGPICSDHKIVIRNRAASVEPV